MSSSPPALISLDSHNQSQNTSCLSNGNDFGTQHQGIPTFVMENVKLLEEREKLLSKKEELAEKEQKLAGEEAKRNEIIMKNEQVNKTLQSRLASLDEESVAMVQSYEEKGLLSMAKARSGRYAALENRIVRIEQLLVIQPEVEGEPTAIEALWQLCGENESRLKALESLVGSGVAVSGCPTEQKGTEGTAEDQRPPVDALGALHELKERVSLIEERTKSLDSSLEFLTDEIREAIAIILSELERRNGIDEEVTSLKNDYERVKGQVSLLVRAASSTTSHPEASRGRLLDPRTFDGVYDANEVDNYLFDMEQYFKLAKTTEDDKIPLASLFLSGDAKLWLRTKVNDAEHHRCRMDSWEDFKKELKSQFYPKDFEYMARLKLYELQQTGSVRDYVQTFMACMLNIQDMSEADKLFSFIRGLKQWARSELNRQHINDLMTAITAAERLDDHFQTNAKRKTSANFRNEPRPFKSGRTTRWF